LVHIPTLAGTAHDLQVPVQAVPQQTPCSQKLELHSAALPQVAPIGFLPQLPVTQLFGGRQSRSAAQIVLHFPSLPHMNGAHVWSAVATQVPSPSQRDAETSVDPVHPCCLHTVPDEYLRQAPVPSQTPSLSQLVAPRSSHSSRGSVPTSAGTQVPTLPCAAQVRQMSVQAALQQTPSAQNPLAQVAPAVQGEPSPSPGTGPSPPGPSGAPPS
jgi:hypothetical protein